MPERGPACPRPARHGSPWRAVGLAIGLFILPPLAAAQPAPAPAPRSGKLADIERERKQSQARAEALAREAAKLDAEAQETTRTMVALAREARSHEQAIGELNQHLAEISDERKTREDGLAARRAHLTQLLAALERIARHPPEALMAYAHTPQDTLRGAMLLRAAIPKLDAEARQLRDDLEALAQLGEQAAARGKALASERAGLDVKRRKLAVLLERKRDLARSTEAEKDKAAARARALAQQATDLRELLAGIERERRQAALRPPRPPDRSPRAKAPATASASVLRPPVPTAGLRISRARGRLIMPVIGRVAVRFGAREEAGAAKGVRFAVADGAQVLAPFDGEVVFSGPFRGYGPLLIIDHGEGYHSLLAGLGRIDAVVGQKLLAGEPIGVMSRREKVPLRLYMEFRQGGRPIDPLPWLAAPPNSKASG